MGSEESDNLLCISLVSSFTELWHLVNAKDDATQFTIMQKTALIPTRNYLVQMLLAQTVLRLKNPGLDQFPVEKFNFRVKKPNDRFFSFLCYGSHSDLW